MAKKKISLERFAAIVEALPAKLSQKTINAARKSAARLVVLVEHSIRTNLPYALVDRGRLVQSVTLVLTPTGAIVRVDAPYAPPLEYGARPFTPPLQPILDWATRKGFEDPKAVAWSILMTFRKKGMKPKRFFYRALQEWKRTQDLPREIRRFLDPRKP